MEKLVSVFDITSVMTFGGEPLYYADVVSQIHKKANVCGVETRQTITSGFFTNNAVQFLSEYYNVPTLSLSNSCLSQPCKGLANVDSIGIDPNGDVVICGYTIGNIYTEDVLDIVGRYNPYDNECMVAVMSGGVAGLLAYAKKQGITPDITKYYSACWDACNSITKSISAIQPTE